MVPWATQAAHSPGVCGATSAGSARRCAQSPSSASRFVGAAQPAPLALAVVEHRLLDVQHGQHLGDHLVRHGAGAAHLQHPAALDVDHHPAPAGVGLGRRLVGPGPELLPGREVAALQADPDLRGHVVRVVLVEARPARPARPCDAWLSRSARASASAAGSGAGTRSRRANQGSEKPCRNRVPAVTVNAIEQQHLAVRGVVRDHERRGQGDHPAHARPIRRSACRSRAWSCRAAAGTGT